MQRRHSLVLLTALISCLGLSALCSVLAIRPGFHSHVDPKVNTDRHSYMEVLDADARIFLWHHFLTEEECDYIKAKADKRLERSGVVDTNTGGTAINEIRTSDGMFFARAEDPVIEGIEKRLAEWTLLPVQNGEGLQVLRYKLGQKYDAHWDYFFDQQNSVNGGNRYATVLMYLRAADEGGETVFPKVPAPHGINANFSECGKYSLAVKPKLGDAILFHSMTPDGVLEERSMHGACPVIKGEKWSMTKWIHAKHYNMGGDTYDKVHNEVMSKLKEHTGHPHFGEHDPSEI